MKKFFFFRSSGSGSENKNSSPQSLTDKDVYWEHPSENGLSNHVENSFCSSKGLFSKSRKQSMEDQSPLTNPGLRRSRSLSSAALQDIGLDRMNLSCPSDRSKSPFTIRSNTPTKKTNNSSRRSVTPDRKPKMKHIEAEAFKNTERLHSSTSHASLQDLSGNSSLSSSNLSCKVVDRYIDGEQQEGRISGNDFSQRIHEGQGQEKSRRPPRAQYTAPSSPAVYTENPKSHSFREVRGPHHNFPTRDWAETGYGYESPHKVARNVIERLSQCSAPQKTSPDGPTCPVTSEDVYVGSLNKPSNITRQYPSSVDGASKTSRAYHVDGLSSFHKKKLSVADSGVYLDSVTNDDEIEVDLQSCLKEANERAMLLSEEFEQQRFICGGDFDVSALIQKIKNLAEEKVDLAFEVSSILQSRIADRTNAKEELRHLRTEFRNQSQRLEREKNEIQSSLEKELDRRSSDWSLKLEKYQSEEYRLRERVRELAEQNAAMQREISALNEKELENKNTVTHSELQLKDQTMRLDELKKQNQDLCDSLAELKEKYKAATEDRDCFRRNYEEKESECKDLHKSITRLMRTTSEQEKTISELRDSLIEKIEGKNFPESLEKHVKKLQAEQIRLTGVEQALRKEVESYKFEAESLRHENIDETAGNALNPPPPPTPPPCELSKLPVEIITDIFSRLPAADLVKFRYLNKSYNSLIQSKCFIKLHLLKTAANINETRIWRVFMDSYTRPLLSIKVEALDKYLGLKLSDQSAGDVVAPFSRPFLVPVRYSIVGSCNGLLCFYSCTASKFLVCNPCTGAHKYYAGDMVTGEFLDFRPRFDWDQFGFGDDGTGRFKIVRLGRCGGQNTVEITIFTLGDSCFRKTEQMEPRMKLLENGLYLEGALHLVDWQDVKRGIIVFSLGKEKFEPVMPLPPYDDDETLAVVELKIICGKLTLSFYRPHQSGSSVFEIWVMEIYGVKESWSRKIAGQSDDLFGELVKNGVQLISILPIKKKKKLISILRNGSVIFTHEDDKPKTAATPVIYDPKEKTFSIIKCDPPLLLEATEYVETLVPPKDWL